MSAGGGGVAGNPVRTGGGCSYVGYGPGTWGAAGGEGLPHDAAPANPVYLAALTSLPLSSYRALWNWSAACTICAPAIVGAWRQLVTMTACMPVIRPFSSASGPMPPVSGCPAAW